MRAVFIAAVAIGAEANVRGKNEVWTEEQILAASYVPNANFSNSPPGWTKHWSGSLVYDEGHELRALNNVTISDCERECEADSACHSFSFSSSGKCCHLKDKCVTQADGWRHTSSDYVTYFKPCPCKDSHSWCPQQASRCKNDRSMRIQCSKTCKTYGDCDHKSGEVIV